MPAISAQAPGKVILFGEHAVVYGRPAIAVPVNQVQVRAIVTANPLGRPDAVRIEAPEIRLNSDLSSLPPTHPFNLLVQAFKKALGIPALPSLTLRVTSTVPVASGLGSGAAVSVACARALSAFIGHPLPDAEINALAFEVEKYYHGTPSGIDNTVITYARPVYFERGSPIETLTLGAAMMLVIANSGIRSPTIEVVSAVRQLWQQEPAVYEDYFNQVGDIARSARAAILAGGIDKLGPLMISNHALLQKIGVSLPELDQLANIAIDNGALGAKLSGAGRGGNMIALTTGETAPAVARALRSAGATGTIITTIPAG